MNAPASFASMPDAQGFFGPYGGQLVPPHLKEAMDAINAAYAEITQRQDFQDELAQLFADRTRILVSHRASTLADAGLRLTLRDGRLHQETEAGHA